MTARMQHSGRIALTITENRAEMREESVLHGLRRLRSPFVETAPGFHSEAAFFYMLLEQGAGLR